MNRIRHVLKEQGRTQVWLSEQVGKSYNMVHSYVSNKRQPSLELLYKIAAILDVDVKVLLESSKKVKV